MILRDLNVLNFVYKSLDKWNSKPTQELYIKCVIWFRKKKVCLRRVRGQLTWRPQGCVASDSYNELVSRYITTVCCYHSTPAWPHSDHITCKTHRTPSKFLNKKPTPSIVVKVQPGEIFPQIESFGLIRIESCWSGSRTNKISHSVHVMSLIM